MWLICDQISNSLTNALDTFGSASEQYRAILAILKEYLQEIEHEKKARGQEQVVDADMLTVAMGFLEIGKSEGRIR